jgi:hypothetical protein
VCLGTNWGGDFTRRYNVSQRKQTEAERLEALNYLHSVLSDGDTVHCILRHVSASGTSRRIDFYTIKDNNLVFLTGYIGCALGLTHRNKGGLKVLGCGMDVGYHTVYTLSRALFPAGGCALKHNWL